MERLLEVLEAKSFAQAQQTIDDSVREAQRMKEGMLEEARQRFDRRAKQDQQKALLLEKQELTRLRQAAINQTNALKETLVNQVIESVKVYFDTLSDTEYFHLLEQILDRYQDTQERPRLIVCERYYEYTLERLGQAYQVLASSKLESGFIFSYRTYDVNFQVDQIFAYYHEEFSRKVAQMMFEDSDETS